MFINGQWIESEQQFSVTNPATGAHLADVADAGAAEAAEAIEAAHKAFASWRNTSAYQRAEILYRAWELMMAERERLAELMTTEQGKPLKAARNEVTYAADFLRWFAEEGKRQYGETIPSARADQRFMVQQAPVGVVAAITPWNYPISMITRKLAPALAAGCTAVLKPAESTPLCAIEVFKILEQAGVPAGVINLVTALDPKPIGEVFCTHPKVRKITFTGSTAVGQKIAADAAPHCKRVSMELGGNAPFIVFDDADPVHAAKGCTLVKFLNTGQACIAPNRIYVHENIADEFIATLTKRIAALKPGNGMEPSSSIGPLINAAAMEKMQTQVDDALEKGATLHLGGKALTLEGMEEGHFFAPTLLSKVDSSMRICHEETFGPIAAVLTFNDDDDILALANDTHYGLAAYVYTQNLSRAIRTSEALDFGIIGVNDINPTSAAAPFGGMKSSGLGREGAREGLSEYLETKLIGLSV